MLPETVQKILEEKWLKLPLHVRQKASSMMSERYRSEGQQGGFRLQKDEKLAYLAVRMPATFQVVSKVLEELKSRSSYPFKSFIDLGSGPGTATLAALSLWSSIEDVRLIDHDADLLDMAASFIQLPIQKIVGDLTKTSYPKADLAVLSYSLGEIPEVEQNEVVFKAWESAHTLVIIEPGTKRGYNTILSARDSLIQSGGKLLAPCPHSLTCPWKNTSDWCHFGARLNRSKEHRILKEAERGFEDEKFSYVIFSKNEEGHALGRIVKRPEIHSGHVRLTICSQDEKVHTEVISRKHKELYSLSKKVEWGDSWDAKI